MATNRHFSIPFKKADGTKAEALIDTNRRIQIDAISSALPDGAATAANQQPASTTTTIYNITLTSANTEYSQALPNNTKQLRFHCRTLYDVRYAWVADKVATPTAPYLTLLAGMEFSAGNMDLDSKTLYLASAQAGVIVEIECNI